MNQSSNKQEGTRPKSTTPGKPSPTQPTKKVPTATQPEVKSKPARKPMPPWVRILLRILRIMLVPMLCVAALIVGVVFGYVYMGGRDSADMWNLQTWKHLFELVFAS